MNKPTYEELEKRIKELEKVDNDHKKAEEKLLFQNVYFTELFESSPEAIVVLDNDDIVVTVNGEFTRLFGYTIEESAGFSINDLIVMESFRKEAERYSGKLAKGERFSTQTKRKHKNGTQIDVSILGAPILSEGIQIGNFSIYRDITEQKKIEEELKERESLLTAFVNALPDVAFIIDEDGRYLEVLASKEKLLFLEADKLKGKLLSEVLPKKTSEGFLKVINRTIETGESQKGEYELGVTAGKTWFESRTSLMDVKLNGKRAVVWIAFDISERRQSEEALREKQYLNEQLLDSIPHAAMLIGRNRKVLVANKIALEVGTKIGDYCWKEFGKCANLSDSNKKLAEKDVNAKGIKCTFCLADNCLNNSELTNDPEVFSFERLWDTYWVPLGDGDTFLHYAIDVTERKQAEDEKSRLIIKLEQALDEVKTLRGFIPICANCKKIRNDDGYWEQIETYISQHSDAQFSHSICEPCAKKLYPDLYDDD